jgi:hypothetical protein
METNGHLMKFLLAFSLSIGFAAAQTVLPWNNPALNVGIATSQQLNVDGVFFVANYISNGTHTDYDMARQAADAYAAANPWTGSLLVLKPTANQTCDAVPLPSLGTDGGKWGTTSIFGFGSGLSSIAKRTGCPQSVATFSHPDSPRGQLSRGWYQGFTVDANHIDSAACEIYGMSLTTFFDITCGNAMPGADHELDFGNRDANFVGWMDNVYIYNLRTFDTVGVGKGAILTPVWTGGALAGVTVTNPGTKKYTQQYTRAQIIGPDLATCSSVPTLTPIVSNIASTTFQNLPTVNYGYITDAAVMNPGNCTSTTNLYILIQDGVPVTYGMKFSNMADSHAWNLEAIGSTVYGEAWLRGSDNNSIFGEHPFANQTIQIAEYANGNKHINVFFDSPGAYGAGIYSQNGTFQNPTFSWDGGSYPGSSGYYFGVDQSIYKNWMISNSQCSSSTSNFVSITTTLGPLATTLPPPSGIKLRDIEACDGTTMLNWPASAK